MHSYQVTLYYPDRTYLTLVVSAPDYQAASALIKNIFESGAFSIFEI